MDTLAGQTEAAIFRLLSNVMSGPSTPVGTTSVGELEIELQRRLAQAELAQSSSPQRHNIPALRSNIEPTSDRFYDRTIPQATTLILRDAGGPLLVGAIATAATLAAGYVVLAILLAVAPLAVVVAAIRRGRPARQL